MDKEIFDRLWDNYLSEQADPNISNPRYREGRYIQQDYTEVWELVKRLVALGPKRCLEIGNACGGTTLVWKAICPFVVSVDLYPVGTDDGVINMDLFEGVEFILGNSHDESVLEKARAFAPYDFLFIDGDHEPEGVLADYQMYSPLVRKGGIVAFHDWGYQHSSGLWPIQECIKTTGIVPEVIQHSHFGIAVLRV